MEAEIHSVFILFVVRLGNFVKIQEKKHEISRHVLPFVVEA